MRRCRVCPPVSNNAYLSHSAGTAPPLSAPSPPQIRHTWTHPEPLRALVHYAVRRPARAAEDHRLVLLVHFDVAGVGGDVGLVPLLEHVQEQRQDAVVQAAVVELQQHPLGPGGGGAWAWAGGRGGRGVAGMRGMALQKPLRVAGVGGRAHEEAQVQGQAVEVDLVQSGAALEVVELVDLAVEDGGGEGDTRRCRASASAEAPRTRWCSAAEVPHAEGRCGLWKGRWGRLPGIAREREGEGEEDPRPSACRPNSRAVLQGGVGGGGGLGYAFKDVCKPIAF